MNYLRIGNALIHLEEVLCIQASSSIEEDAFLVISFRTGQEIRVKATIDEAHDAMGVLCSRQ